MLLDQDEHIDQQLTTTSMWSTLAALCHLTPTWHVEGVSGLGDLMVSAHTCNFTTVWDLSPLYSRQRIRNPDCVKSGAFWWRGQHIVGIFGISVQYHRSSKPGCWINGRVAGNGEYSCWLDLGRSKFAETDPRLQVNPSECDAWLVEGVQISEAEGGVESQILSIGSGVRGRLDHFPWISLPQGKCADWQSGNKRLFVWSLATGTHRIVWVRCAGTTWIEWCVANKKFLALSSWGAGSTPATFTITPWRPCCSFLATPP